MHFGLSHYNKENCSVQSGIYAIGKVHIKCMIAPTFRSGIYAIGKVHIKCMIAPSFRNYPSVAFETVPVFV